MISRFVVTLNMVITYNDIYKNPSAPVDRYLFI